MKKEIDAGGTISIDGYNSESTDAPGTGENLGHQVSIVGYVTPTSGTQTPYYVVWNPWWQTTFYLSANAKTFNLGGVKYKWTRTWHNWKKVSPASRSVQSIDPEIGKQKVASTANPMALKETTKLSLDLASPGTFTSNLQNFNNQDILSQNVAQYGNPVRLFDLYYSRVEYWYAYRNDNEAIQIGMNLAMVPGNNRTNTGVGKFVNDFKSLENSYYHLSQSFPATVSMAAIWALFSITGGVPGAILIGVVDRICSAAGITTDAAGLISDMIAHKSIVNALKRDFAQAVLESKSS